MSTEKIEENFLKKEKKIKKGNKSEPEETEKKPTKGTFSEKSIKKKNSVTKTLDKSLPKKVVEKSPGKVKNSENSEDYSEGKKTPEKKFHKRGSSCGEFPVDHFSMIYPKFSLSTEIIHSSGTSSPTRRSPEHSRTLHPVSSDSYRQRGGSAPAPLKTPPSRKKKKKFPPKIKSPRPADDILQKSPSKRLIRIHSKEAILPAEIQENSEFPVTSSEKKHGSSKRNEKKIVPKVNVDLSVLLYYSELCEDSPKESEKKV